MRQTVTLHNAQQGHTAFMALWQAAKALLMAEHKLVVEIRPLTRSREQNALMWSCLSDLSNQLMWPVDGRPQRLTPDEWKEILTAGMKRETRVAQGISGGFVILGSRTSKLTIAEMSDLITLCHAFGDGQDVRWSRTSLGRDVPDLEDHTR